MASAIREVTYPWWYYLQNLTMTQWLTMTVNYYEHRSVVPWGTGVCFNPPHWSLNYEEQFYLLMGCAVLLAIWIRPAVTLLVLTVSVALAGAKIRAGFTGLFCDYWLQFATGLILYYRLCVAQTVRARRILDVVTALLLALVVWVAYRGGELAFDSNLQQYYGQLAVCMAFAALLLVMRRWDHVITSNLVGKLLCRFGAISYSLYLVHYPFIKLTWHIHERIEGAINERSADLIIILAIVGVSYLFYLAFEKPFVNRNRREQAAIARAAAKQNPGPRCML
jgi:peptidoglycan/LPS O-acetylase OafA/YrhL